MRIASEISIRPIESEAEVAIPVSEIIINGEATGRFVSGAILEAAVKCDDFYLLFMTDDTPYEEMLTLHLLDSEWSLLDSAALGSLYATGKFSALRLEEPNLIHFRFIDEADWCVEILPRPVFRLPFIPDATGVKRDGGIKRHFIIHRQPDGHIL